MNKISCILIAFTLIFSAQAQQPKQKFVADDILHFWDAYDKIWSTTDTVVQKKYLDELFIKKGTAGLKGLMEVRNYSAGEYLESIKKYPKFWSSIRKKTLESSRHYPAISADIAKLKKLYPGLKPSIIYFAIGVFRSNGTIEGQKVLLGTEMALSDKTVDVSELPDHPKEFNALHNPVDDIAFLCTHEYIHTQQKELVHNLLTYSIYEGIAEFMATLATGKKPYLSGIAYGEKNYEKVRDKFEQDLYLPNRTYDWLWSTRQIFGERDLGYAVGFGIARRYYEKASDKKKAISDMIELDFANEAAVESYVDGSGYLSRPIQQIYENYENARPTVINISGVENGSKQVLPGTARITVHFSEPLNGHNTGIDFGPLGQDFIPAIERDRIWSGDNKSWSFQADLKPNKHYQILISNNFRLANDIRLKPFLIEFWTKE